MPALTCPYCSAFANFSERARWEASIAAATVPFAAWICDACHMPVVGPVDTTSGGPAHYEPRHVATREFPDVPTPIAEDAKEAYRCLSIGAWRASAAMARRSIQASAYEKGAPESRLIDQIDWLAENGLIPEQMRNVAHQIRLGGNLGAHPHRDGLRDVGEGEARSVLQFLEDFLRYVYEIPARLGRLTGGTP